MTDHATGSVQSLTDTLLTVPEFGQAGNEKVFAVYSEDDLVAKIKFVKVPAVGVMYEGLTPRAGDPTGRGLVADVRVACVLMMDAKIVGLPETKNEAGRLLDLMRTKLLSAARQAGGRQWKFLGEAPAGTMNGYAVYLQRWGTQIILA